MNNRSKKQSFGKYTEIAPNMSARKRRAAPTCRSRKEDYSKKKKTSIRKPILSTAKMRL